MISVNDRLNVTVLYIVIVNETRMSFWLRGGEGILNLKQRFSHDPSAVSKHVYGQWT